MAWCTARPADLAKVEEQLQKEQEMNDLQSKINELSALLKQKRVKYFRGKLTTPQQKLLKQFDIFRTATSAIKHYANEKTTYSFNSKSKLHYTQRHRAVCRVISFARGCSNKNMRVLPKAFSNWLHTIYNKATEGANTVQILRELMAEIRKKKELEDVVKIVWLQYNILIGEDAKDLVFQKYAKKKEREYEKDNLLRIFFKQRNLMHSTEWTQKITCALKEMHKPHVNKYKPLRIAAEKKKAEEAARLEEEARIVAEKKKAEEATRLEEEARIAAEKKKAEEAARLEEEARIAAEKKKAEEAACLEEKTRIAAEMKKKANEAAAEAARLEEETRIAAEMKRKAEEAATEAAQEWIQEIACAKINRICDFW